MPLVPVLSRMERTGVLIDANVLAAQSVELTARLDELENRRLRLRGRVQPLFTEAAANHSV